MDRKLIFSARQLCAKLFNIWSDKVIEKQSNGAEKDEVDIDKVKNSVCHLDLAEAEAEEEAPLQSCRLNLLNLKTASMPEGNLLELLEYNCL